MWIIVLLLMHKHAVNAGFGDQMQGKGRLMTVNKGPNNKRLNPEVQTSPHLQTLLTFTELSQNKTLLTSKMKES